MHSDRISDYPNESWISSQSVVGDSQAGQWLYYDGSPNFLRHAAKEKNIYYVNEKYRDCFQMQSDITVEQKAEIDCKYNKALN